MRRVTLGSIALAVASAVLASLAACSMPGTVPRESITGQVTDRALIAAAQLLPGDCFSPSSANSDLAKVEIIPCADMHDYVVLDQGNLSAEDILTAGTLQNAVSAACADTFATFVETLAEGITSTQEFMVMPNTVDGVVTQAYSCIATMPTSEADAE
jgi:hypothetical protein